MAAALRDAGQWAEIVDHRWRYVYMTDDLRLSMGGVVELAPVPIGAHYFGPEAVSTRRSWRNGPKAPEFLRPAFAAIGGWTLADTPGGRDELRQLVDPALRDIVDELSPADPQPALSYAVPGTGIQGTQLHVMATAVRVHDATGKLAGTAVIFRPEAGMAVLATVAAGGDLHHLERMQCVAKPARRPAAILFADLEASSPLARRLSTSGYFALGRRLVRAADQCVIDAGGIVGRHVGDAVAAFFLVETAGSESAAARACIGAARAFRDAVADVAFRQRSRGRGRRPALRPALGSDALRRADRDPRPLRSHRTRRRGQRGRPHRSLRKRGRALASKTLVERLEPDDAAALELDPYHVTYTALAHLPTATEKGLPPRRPSDIRLRDLAPDSDEERRRAREFSTAWAPSLIASRTPPIYRSGSLQRHPPYDRNGRRLSHKWVRPVGLRASRHGAELHRGLS